MARPLAGFVAGIVLTLLLLLVLSVLVLVLPTTDREAIALTGSDYWSRYLKVEYRPGATWAQLWLDVEIQLPETEQEVVEYRVTSTEPWFPSWSGTITSQQRVRGWVTLSYAFDTPHAIREQEALRLAESVTVELQSPGLSRTATFQLPAGQGWGLGYSDRAPLLEWWWDWWFGSLRNPRTKFVNWRPSS